MLLMTAPEPFRFVNTAISLADRTGPSYCLTEVQAETAMASRATTEAGRVMRVSCSIKALNKIYPSNISPRRQRVGKRLVDPCCMVDLCCGRYQPKHYFGNDKVASWFPVASLKNMYRLIDRLHTPSVVL